MKRMNEEKLDKMAEFIMRYIEENNGRSPKFSEILEYMQMGKSVGYRYLTTLKDRGIVEYSGRSSLSVKGQDAMRTLFRKTPIYGAIPCGAPEDNYQSLEGYVAIPEEWTEGDCYLLKADGDSMIDIGIDRGDLVLIKKAEEAFDGQVVAVLTENGTTLKRYKQDETGRPWLLAENSGYSEKRRKLYPKQIVVQGIVLKVIKDIK